MNILKLAPFSNPPKKPSAFPFKLKGSNRIQIPVRPDEYFEVANSSASSQQKYIPINVKNYLNRMKKAIPVFLNEHKGDDRIEVLYSNTTGKPFNITSVFDSAGNLLERLIHKRNGEFVRTVWSQDGKKCATHIVNPNDTACRSVPKKVFAWAKDPETRTTEIRTQEYDLGAFWGPKVTQGKNIEVKNTVTPVDTGYGVKLNALNKNITTTEYDTTINRQKTNSKITPIKKGVAQNIMESIAN